MNIAGARNHIGRTSPVLVDDANLATLAATDGLVPAALGTLATTLDALDDDSVAFVKIGDPRAERHDRAG